MTNIFPLSLFLLIIIAMNCSTAKTRVLPGPEGRNKAISRDIEKEGAKDAAFKAANGYCKDKGKEALFRNQNSQYIARIDEGTAGSKIGTVGYTMTSERDYEAQVDFKCQ